MRPPSSYAWLMAASFLPLLLWAGVASPLLLVAGLAIVLAFAAMGALLALGPGSLLARLLLPAYVRLRGRRRTLVALRDAPGAAPSASVVLGWAGTLASVAFAASVLTQGLAEGTEPASASAKALTAAAWATLPAALLVPSLWCFAHAEVRALDERTGLADAVPLPPLLDGFGTLAAVLALWDLASQAQGGLVDRLWEMAAVSFAALLVLLPVSTVLAALYAAFRAEKDAAHVHRRARALVVADVQHARPRDASVASADAAVASAETAPAP